MTDQMISVDLDGREKRLNPRNIAYVITRTSSIRFSGYFTILMMFIISVTPTFVLFSSPIIVGVSVLIGLILSYSIYRKIRVPDIQSVGTVNNSYDIESKSMNPLRSSFESSPQESVHITGDHRATFVETDYSYHLTPDNIVSLDHIDKSVPRSLSVSFALISLITIIFSSFNYTGVDRLSGVTIGISLLLVTSVFVISNRPDVLNVEFTNGESKSIPLSEEKYNELVDYISGEESNPAGKSMLDSEDVKQLEDEERKKLERDDDPNRNEPKELESEDQ